jgi:catechol 2,3-dioxygenase-like lactoylglutathione lyase family enzyme
MSIKRVVPDIMSQRMDESRKFYAEFLGFDVAMGMGWVLTFASPQNPTAQITVMQRNEKATPQPNMSVEVDNVDAVHPKALELGLPIVIDAHRGDGKSSLWRESMAFGNRAELGRDIS